MRHRIKGYKLGRTAAHRNATLAELSTALLSHKRITTTLTKAKALRMFVEPIINRAKDDTTHNRRQVFRRLGSKHAVNVLFDEVAEKIQDRPGGFTRVVRLGQRPGDGAEMAVIEMVDYNDVKPDGSPTKKKTRRTRRGSGTGRRPSAKAEDGKTKAKAPKETAAAEPAAAEAADETVEPDAGVAAVDESATEESPTTAEAAVEVAEAREEEPGATEEDEDGDEEKSS